MKINKEDVEQLKRDLYSYGYYLKKIDEILSKLAIKSSEIERETETKSPSLEFTNKKSDPKHPIAARLILEEGELIAELNKIIKIKEELNLDDINDFLTKIEYTIIDSHFFQKISYANISSNLNFNYEEKARKIADKALKKIIINRKRRK